MERYEFDLQMTRLEGLKKNIHPEMINAYWEALSKYSYDDFIACITKILQEDLKFPKVPRLLEILSPHKGGNILEYRQKSLPRESFHCSQCDVDFSVMIGASDSEPVFCPGNGTSHCGKQWSVADLKIRLLDAQERQEKIIVL